VAHALFEFRDVSVAHQGRRLVAGLNATVPDGLVTVLAGPSGSGKSTLLRLCNRLQATSTGSVRFRCRDVAAIDPLRLRREVGMVFQRSTTLPGTVADNLRAADPDAGPDDIATLLERVGLAGYEDRPAHALSGGQAQRMCVARTLAARPEVVLWDEPTSALDATTARAVERIALDLAAAGTPSVWVTHDVGQLRRLAQHLVVLSDGEVAQAGPADAVLARPGPAAEQLLAGAA
jgi:putative ABC transport system ATP-binding protein